MIPSPLFPGTQGLWEVPAVSLFAHSLAESNAVRTGVIEPRAKRFEISSLGKGGVRTAQTDPLRQSLRQKKRKKSPTIPTKATPTS